MAFRLAAVAQPPANPLSLPICRAQFPSPGSVPGTRSSLAIRVPYTGFQEPSTGDPLPFKGSSRTPQK